METAETQEKSDRRKEAGNELVFSYLTLRNLIGISGMLLPLVLLLTTKRTATDRWVEPSISDYYYSSNGDVLVVMLSILGVFLITYQGYNWKENALSTLAAVGGLGVAFSPTATQYANSLSIHSILTKVPTLLGIERHFIFAAIFFISLAIISLKYFPRTDKYSLRTAQGELTQKAKRNRVHKICGWIIVICVVLLGAYFIFKPDAAPSDVPVVFTLETIAVEAFGISWITKGQTLWPDGEHYLKKGYREAKMKLSS
jgi:hypothetical protein